MAPQKSRKSLLLSARFKAFLLPPPLFLGPTKGGGERGSEIGVPRTLYSFTLSLERVETLCWLLEMERKKGFCFSLTTENFFSDAELLLCSYVSACRAGGIASNCAEIGQRGKTADKNCPDIILGSGVARQT